MTLIVFIGHAAEVSFMGYDKNIIVHKDHEGVKKCNTEMWVKKNEQVFKGMTEELKSDVFSRF